MKEKLMKNMGYLIVLLDVAIYFIVSYLFVDKIQTNILSIIVNSALLFVGAIIATNALMKQGILTGRDTQRYKDTLTAHITQKNKIYPKIKHLQSWLDADYRKLMKMGRTVYVNSAGFDFEEIFTEEGKVKDGYKVKKPDPVIYKTKWQKLTAWIRRLFRWMFSEDWKIYRQKKAFIRKAKRYKVTRQTVSYLINIDEDKDPNDYGETEKQYTRRQSTINTVSRLFFSVLLQTVAFGFYGFNMRTFIVQLLNIVLILVSAFWSMYNAYFFMVKTHRETIIKKINKLEEFDSSDLTEFENKLKEKEDGKVHSEESMSTKTNVVEEIPEQPVSRQEGDLCGNSISGV